MSEIIVPTRKYGGPGGYGSRINPAHDAMRAARPHVRELFALAGVDAATTLPEGASNRAYGPTKRLDQGPTSACVGHARAGAIYTSLGAAHTPIVLVPSPKWIYTLARCIDRGTPGTPLTDNGSDPASATLAIQQYGTKFLEGETADGRFSDCEPDTINDEPDLGEFEDAANFILEGEYALPKSDPNFEMLFKMAIANGYAVNFATYVDTAFENWDPDKGLIGSPNYNDPKGGGHDLYADSYSINDAGELVIGFVNSWGYGWGDNGYGEGNASFLQSWSNVFVTKVKRT